MPPLRPPVDTSVITAARGKYIRTADGRIVEYCVQEPTPTTTRQNGNNDDDDDTAEIVMVTAYVADYLLDKHYKYKTVSISLPGLGNSDFYLGQDISKWPETDLLPILKAENINEFIVWGNSLGTQYAMATGQYDFGNDHRVKAVGLRVPFLPRHISQAHGLPQGQPTLPSSNEIQKNTLAVRITRFFLKLAGGMVNPGPFGQWVARNGLLGGNMKSLVKFIQDHPKEGSYLQSMMKHFGAESMLCACAQDIVLDSTIDPREMNSDKGLVVWYASDDDDCPPSHGKWIVDNLKCHDVRVFEGYGHVGAAFLEMDAFLDKLVESSKS